MQPQLDLRARLHNLGTCRMKHTSAAPGWPGRNYDRAVHRPWARRAAAVSCRAMLAVALTWGRLHCEDHRERVTS